ncbi:hypothetical protein Tco_1300075, partial [Tanacetum coccineum]
YLKGQPKLGLWYPKDSPFDLIAYTDSDYARANLDRKPTTREKAKNNVRLMMEKLAIDKNRKSVLGVIITEATVRRDLQLNDAEGTECLPNAIIFEQLTLIGAKTTAWNEFSSTMASVIICLTTNQKFNFSKYIFESMMKNLENVSADEAVNKEMDDSLERASTTATGLNAEHDMGNINKTQSKATPNEPSSLGTSSGGGPRRQDTMGDIIAQTRSENVSKYSNDSLLTRVNTPQSDEDRLKLKELMELYTNLQKKVLDLETSKTSQAEEIASLKRRVGLSARVESSEESLGKEDASKQGRINAIDADEDIYLVNVERDKDMFGVNDLEGDEVVVKSEVAAKKKDDEVNVVEEVVSTASDAAPVSAATITIVELTLAQTLAELKSARPKTKGILLQEPSESISTTTTTTTAGILL